MTLHSLGLMSLEDTGENKKLNEMKRNDLAATLEIQHLKILYILKHGLFIKTTNK